MSDIVISAQRLGKKYLIGHQANRERYTALRDKIGQSLGTFMRSAGNMMRGRQLVAGDTVEEFWALRDVDFEIRRGEVVGIIGRNGAGKSTLLKILSRITEPSEGRVAIRGRVASLLEVGTGFHPELTGRENIFLNGAILGMTRSEIRRKFEEIVSFAEVERFLDTPVKRYSSGMYVRLAFAVAAHLDPEILVVDEVLAVGDIEFQKKCLGKMSEVAGGGRTVLFVSHNMAAIQALCSRSIYLAGTIIRDGQTDEVISAYLQGREKQPRGAAGGTKIHDGLVLKAVHVEPAIALTGSEVGLKFRFQAAAEGQIREFALLLYTLTGVRVGIIDLRESGTLPFKHGAGEFSISIRIPELPVIEGAYTIGLWIVTDERSIELLELEELRIAPALSSYDFAPYHPEHRGLVVLPFTTEYDASSSLLV